MRIENYFKRGLWGCERKENCGWQGFMLTRGISEGEIPKALDPKFNCWRNAHDHHCGGDLVQLIKPNQETVCKWEESEFGIYLTSCGGAFEFNEGTPKQNDANFCPYCGKILETVGFKEDLEKEKINGH